MPVNVIEGLRILFGGHPLEDLVHTGGETLKSNSEAVLSYLGEYILIAQPRVNYKRRHRFE